MTECRHSYAPIPSCNDDEDEQQQQQIHKVLKERWVNLVRLFDDSHPQEIKRVVTYDDDELAEEEEETEIVGELDVSDSDYISSTTSSSDENDTDDEDGEDEWDELQHDLDYTSASLNDLELEFAQDLQALAQGLESAFENFSPSHKDLFQEQQLSQSTRSNFTYKHRVQASLQQKRRQHQQQDDNNDNNKHVAPPLQQQQQEEFQNWFDRFWSIMERMIQQHVANKQLQLQQQQQCDVKTSQEYGKQLCL